MSVTPTGLAIAGATPGPDLDAVLTPIDVASISGYETVEVLKAWERQVSRDRAMMLRAVLETGLRTPGSGDDIDLLPEPGEFASEEARAALVWSRRRARDTFEFAWDVHVRLPMLGEAMVAGELDEHRAAALATWTRELELPQAEFICDELLPQCATMLVGALIDQIKRLAIALDPAWAERRYRKALNERRVVASRNPDGSADVSGRNLPVDRAKAGCDRIDALARACKAAGDTRPIDHIRADLYLGMIDGSFAGMGDDQIVACVLARPLVADGSAADEATTAGKRCADAQAESSDGSGRVDGIDEDVLADDGDDFVDDADSHQTADDTDGLDGDVPGGDDFRGVDGDVPGEDDGSDEGPAGGAFGRRDPFGPGGRGTGGGACERSADGAQASGSAGNGRAWGVRELRVELTTVLGRDEHPGEIPPWGYVPASVARDLAGAMRGGEWRFVVCDEDGYPICSGITMRRPGGHNRRGASLPIDESSYCGNAQGTDLRSSNVQVTSGSSSHSGRAGRRRAEIVELQVRASDLSWLDAACAEAGDYPLWARMIEDIATRVGAGDVDTDHAATQVRRRFPTAGLRRLVEVRARYCTHPACRAPASTGDHDHAVEYAKGGQTNAANLHPPCRHDHRLRHDGGWQVALDEQGTASWTSPLGHSYRTHPVQVIAATPPQWTQPTVIAIDKQPSAGSGYVPAKILDVDDDDAPPF